MEDFAGYSSPTPCGKPNRTPAARERTARSAGAAARSAGADRPQPRAGWVYVQRSAFMSLTTWRMVPECDRITMLSARTNGPLRCTPSMKSESVMPVATK